jgi:3D (Asp-Asp-Asp) domain-containing protein
MDDCQKLNKNYLYGFLLIALASTCAVLVIYCLNINNEINQYREKYKKECSQTVQILKSNQSLESSNKAQKDKLKQYDVLKKQNENMKKEMEDLKKQKEKLEAARNELVADNLELQKSIKKAASAGVTPQSYKIYNSENLRNSKGKGKYIGKFLGTAYTPSVEECGNNKGITSSGQPIIPGVSVAIDNKHWPYGTIFYIAGLGYTVAMDTGSAIKGKKRFDFAVLDKQFANELGQQYYDVYLVKMGNGKIDNTALF